MSAVAYFAGLVTPAILYALFALALWLTSKNLEIECHKCGRVFGEIGHEYARVTQLRAKFHRCLA